MTYNLSSTALHSKEFVGHFILTSEAIHTPAGWKCIKHNEWQLFTHSLPITDVYDNNQNWAGWCIGYPIFDGVLTPKEIVIDLKDEFIDGDDLPGFYNRNCGKWILILPTKGLSKVYLDPYGSLATVFAVEEKIITSSISLFNERYETDEEIINATGFPYEYTWLPAGLTTKKNVRRLLPNHLLDLNEWKVQRHWPSNKTNLSIATDIRPSINVIVEDIKQTLAAIAAEHSLCFSLTAGRDSRMLLACARNLLNHSSFFSFGDEKISLDMKIAGIIARKFRLNHRFITMAMAAHEEMERWLLLTGLSVSDSIWEIHKTMESFDEKEVFLPGMAGEVGRGYYWRSEDNKDRKFSAADILERCKLPQHERLLAETEIWLKELQSYDAFTILDLTYIEQRLGCWAAPQHYGNRTSVFELTPFNSRKVFNAMMQLPHNYRLNQQLPVDVCKSQWPELLAIPFNQDVSVRGYIFGTAKKVKNLLKSIKWR